jgi:hypothetical protein
MSTGLVGSGTILPYAHLRAFIVQFISENQYGLFDPNDDRDLSEVARRCSAHVMLQLGGHATPTKRDENDDGLSMVIAAQISRLEMMKAYIGEALKALKDSQGDSAISTAPTLRSVWHKYGLSPDLDSAKLYGMGVHRHSVQALAPIFEPLEKMLDANVKDLSELAAAMPTEGEDDDDNEVDKEAMELDSA